MQLGLLGTRVQGAQSIALQKISKMILASDNMHGYILLPPFQIVGRLIFSTLNLTTRLIQKFVQNITSFVVACFINTNS